MTINVIERDIETKIDGQLRSLGWIETITSRERNIFKQQAKTQPQNDLLKTIRGNRTAPDYVLYKKGSDQPLAVIEAKRPNKDIASALEQAKGYAKKINCPIVFATNGVFTKSLNIIHNKPLVLNGAEVDFFLDENTLLAYCDDRKYEFSNIDNKIITSRKQLISCFKSADEILRSEGLEKGLDRFSEFANLLFLKILTEEGNNLLNISWEKDIAHKTGQSLVKVIHDNFEKILERYHAYGIFNDKLRIKNIGNLEELVRIINPIKFSSVDIDIKGDSFEYFLHSYSKGAKNDIGQFFTPRHIIRIMTKILEPKLGEKIYDPFCGTGGMLIQCFKFIKDNKKLDDDQLHILKNQTLFGNDINDVARIAKMNMILFGDGHTNIKKQDSFASPVDKKYDVVITNIPFSQKTKYGSLYDIPTENGDSIAVQHCLRSLKDDENARACIIVPIGFTHIPAQKQLRQWIMENYKIEKVIDLSPKVFLPYTHQHTAILHIRNKNYSSMNSKSYYFYKVKNDGFSQNSYRTKITGYNDLDKVGDNKYEKEIFFTNMEKKEYKFKQINITYLKDEFPLSNFIKDVKKGGGISPNNEPYYFDAGVHPFVMVDDISRYGTQFCLQTTKYKLNNFGVEKNNPHLFPKNTIVLSTSGVATLLNHRALLGVDAYLSSTVAGIVVDEKKIDPYYLFYCLFNFSSADILYDEGYPGLTTTLIKNIPIQMVGDSRMKEIASYIKKMVDIDKSRTELFKKLNK